MIRRIFILAVAASLVGCAGASSEIVAPGAKVPISLSRGVRDADGEIVPQSRQEIVGHFEQDATAWGMAYSLAKLTPTTDISDAVNEQVARADGQAVVRLSVRSKPCALNFVEVLNWLPFWPGCSNLVIAGDIIRVKKKAPPPVAVAEPAPPPAPPAPEPTPPPTTKKSKKSAKKVSAR
jgi:hypothetical protein